MRIRCPFCGERDASEFAYLGDAKSGRSNTLSSEEGQVEVTDGRDAQTKCFEAVYLRDNPAGPHQELWYHAFGCHSWLRVVRDTRTHEILAVEFVRQAASS